MSQGGESFGHDAVLPPGFVGSSAIMRGVYERIRLAARSQAPVFVTGRCGTGKELCARAIHLMSARADAPFVRLNCATLAPDVIAAELFGQPGTAGALALADGGTLFLDEVGALGPRPQAMLLQVLQTGTIRPPGAEAPRSIDVRLICAGKEDLIAAVDTGAFRDDLYYRLHVIPVHLPPLADRDTDVIEIAESALPRIAAEEGRRFSGLDASARALLPALKLRGNVRELLNLLRQIVVMNDADRITAAMFPADLRAGAGAEGLTTPPAPPPAQGRHSPLAPLLGRSLAEIERMVIEATIADQNGSVTRAARILEVAPSTLYRKMESWGTPPRPVR